MRDVIFFLFFCSFGLSGKSSSSSSRLDKSPATDLRVALCLVGEMRKFELTVASLFHHLVKYLAIHSSRVDIFFSSFLSEDSFKLALLNKELELLKLGLPQGREVNIQGIKMTIQYPYQSSKYSKLAVPNCASGRDGIFGLYNLTLGCNEMILSEEKKGNFLYHTILKTRPDALWYEVPKNLPILFQRNQTCVLIPRNYNYKGLNDRFMIGPRNQMILANNRFETLQQGQISARSKNSEVSLKREMEMNRICVTQISCEESNGSACPVPFCLLRLYRPSDGPITTEEGIHPVYDGGSCMPCKMRHCKTIHAEWKTYFQQQMTTFHTFGPILHLNHLLGRMKHLSDCERILSVTLRGIRWISDSTFGDVCLFWAAGVGASNSSLILPPKFREDILKTFSPSTLRGLQAWTGDESCLHFPGVLCSFEEFKLVRGRAAKVRQIMTKRE